MRLARWAAMLVMMWGSALVALAVIGASAHASPRACRPGEVPAATYRYALIAPPFEPAQNIALADLRAAWQRGDIAATADTAAALAPVLGAHAGPSAQVPDDTHWAIVPADALSPQYAALTVDGAHPLAGAGPLALPTCGPANIDPAHLTTLVMSGTTAMTGRTAERIDTSGIADTVRFIRPFFAAADLVHVSNEVAFVKNCKPRTGQLGPFVFCSRDRYVELLAALHVNLVELTGSHLRDYGERSLERTIDMYAQRGWVWFGGGRTQLESTEPRLVEDHGNRLAFVGCNAVNWWVKAIYQGSGTANCDWDRMVWQIHDLRRRGYTPIATVQHRELRTHAPPPDLVRDLRRLAEAGAVFVEGSQAHVAHPWDVHFGAFVHYGPGNLLFAQFREEQRNAVVDKLYIHAGKLLTVAHLYVRTEHGQPRLLDDRERARFLGQLATAEATIAPPSPAGVPALPPASRERPDSVVVAGRAQHLSIIAPAHLEAGVRYPLVVDLALTTIAAPGAFTVVRTGAAIANGDDIAAYMRAKFPIDPARVTITPAAETLIPRKLRRNRPRRATEI